MAEYWRERELKHIEKMIKDDIKLAKKIRDNQLRAMREVQQQIDAFYGRYATTEGIAMEEARKRVSKLDIDAYSKKAKRYVKGAHSSDPMIQGLSFTKRANEEMRLYNLTMKVNRLELLKANINLELVAMTNADEHFLLDAFTKGAREEYLRQAGILGETIAFNERNIATIVNSSFLNATWSERLWDNQNALRSEIERLLNRGIVQGTNPKVLARELRKKFDTSVANSEKLLRTEMAKIQGEVVMDSYKRAGYEQYVWIAEPTACDECAELDNGKPFNLKDAEVGINYIPKHPNCRCSVASYMSREEWDRKLKERGL